MIGQKLAHYEIQAKIGSGGMGDVYRARDTRLDRDVALKVLPEAMARDPERRKRFEREAKAIAALKHPNIVTIYSVENHEGTLFLTMELVDGKNLSEITPADGLDLGKFFEIALPLTDAVSDAHAVGITHRDLKPENIMVDNAGRVKVLDFGLAKLFQTDPDSDKTVGVDSDTQPGMVLGTVSYMSPEQAEGKKIDRRSDIFSLGIVLYEMATGERPFKGDTNLSIMTSILRDTPVSVTDVKRTLPNQLGRILEHCMAKEPGRRFQSAADVRNEIEALKAEVSSDTARHKAVSLGPGRPVKRFGVIAAAGAVIVLLAVIFGPSIFKGGSGGRPAVQPAEANSLAIFPFENLKNPDDPDRIGQIMQELLITDLSSLDAVKVYSSQRLQDVQKQISGGDGRRPGQLAGQVASRAGAETMLTGTLSQLGEKWILTCQIVKVDDGTIIQSKRIDGNDLYTMVDQLTREFHADLRVGEPEEIATKLPVAQKTSSSLEAYRHYLTGVDHLNALQFGEAIAELQQAVDIDPKFGQAYYKLGIAKWWNTSTPGAGKEDLEYLLDHALYASEKERRMAETMLPLVKFQWSEGLPMAQRLTEDYPDEKEAWYALGEANFHFPGGGHGPEGLAAFQHALELDPDFELTFDHIFGELWQEKRTAEAIAMLDERIKKDPANPRWYHERASFVIYSGTEQEADAAIQTALEHSPTPESQARLYSQVGLGWDSVGDLDKAEKYRQMALETDPGHDDPALQRQLFWTLVRQSKFDDAERIARPVFDGDPDRDDAAGWMLNLFTYEHEYTKGREFAEALIARDPDNSRWHEQRVRFAIWEGDDAMMTAAMNDALDRVKSTDDRRRLFQETADAWADVGESNTALTFYDKAIAAEPDNEYPDLLADVGWIYLRHMQRFRAAETWFRRTLAADPENVDALIGMMTLGIERGDIVSATRYGEQAIDAIPVEFVAPYVRATIQIYAGNLGEAQRALETARAGRTSEAQRWDSLFRNLGPAWAYVRTGHFAEAADMFRTATKSKLAERRATAHEGLGWTLLCQGQIDAAENMFQEGLKRGYDHGQSLAGLATVSFSRGNLEQSEAFIMRAMTEARPHTQTQRMLAYLKADQGMNEDALAIAQQTVAADSTRESLELLAWVSVAGDLDLTGGIELAQAAMAIPRSAFFDINKFLAMPAPAEHTLGLAYLKQGDPEKAVAYLEQAAAYQPNRQSVQRDLERAQEMASRRP